MSKGLLGCLPLLATAQDMLGTQWYTTIMI